MGLADRERYVKVLTMQGEKRIQLLPR